MDKPFDLKDLGSRLVKGLKSQAVPAADALLSWAGESCALVQNDIVKGVGAVVLAVKPAVLNEVAKAVAGAPAAATLEVAAAKPAAK